TTSCFVLNRSPLPVIYTLSLHDALPILLVDGLVGIREQGGEQVIFQQQIESAFTLPAEEQLEHFIEQAGRRNVIQQLRQLGDGRSEEHTSELQSRENLVCRLLLEKKKSK